LQVTSAPVTGELTSPGLPQISSSAKSITEATTAHLDAPTMQTKER
jgi:hypothetical protein